MKFITTEQFLDHFAGKSTLVLSDLIPFIEEEFAVSLRVEESEDDRDVDVKKLANDEEILRHIRTSREDRQAGRVYKGQSAIDMFNKKAGERRRGSNV